MAIPMNGAVLRLIDANANRAREGLRVAEDFARFVLNDQSLSSALKEIRHEFATVLGPLLGEAILHRDTPGDVGTSNKTQAEQRREDVADVVIAAGKRLGEALRAIEEYLKTIAPADAARIEQLRYRFYDIEQRLARTLCPAKRFAEVRLYVLITERCCRGDWFEAAEQALLGGADCLQLREKELESGELLRRARRLVELCRRYDTLCIINDRPDIAILAGADGVHVGQGDLPAIEARKLIGREKILGVSTHCIEQAKQALLDGADYIGIGPVFPSATKPRDFVAGLEYARQVATEIQLPAVAIAGITAANVDEVIGTGVRAVAVTAAVMGSDDPRQAAAELKARLTGERVERASAPVEREVKTTQRRLPHWAREGSTYFVTFRVMEGELQPADRKVVLDHVRHGAGKFYGLAAAVVMPDHVHLLLQPRRAFELPRVMKGLKGVSARLVNDRRGSHGMVWQDESWDRIVRDQSEFDEKLEYMLNNPVKKGLVEDPWTYDAWYYNAEWEAELL
ncbi:MAG TPA: thiamine phosphate synthase [Tepidisphaeraceae bacterium]